MERPDIEATEYRLVMRHSIANQRRIDVAIMDDGFTRQPLGNYRLACRWCGAEYHDAHYHPGTCTNCGGPK
jgi:rRNA maturation endonuclease Nob1